jgi:hypothetical protein
MASKRESSNAGSASKPKKTRDVLSISEKLKLRYMIEIEKGSNAEIVRLYGKNDSSILELMENKENTYATFFVAPQTAKVTAIAPDKLLIEVGNVFNFWVEDMNRKRVPLFITLYNFFNFGIVLL